MVSRWQNTVSMGSYLHAAARDAGDGIDMAGEKDSNGDPGEEIAGRWGTVSVQNHLIAGHKRLRRGGRINKKH